MPPTSQLDRLKKLTATATSASALRAEGIDLIPIDPDNNIDEKVYAKFLDAGRPGKIGELYGGRLLVTPEQWEARRRRKTQSYDPLTRKLRTDDDVRDWQALPPIKVGEKELPVAFELLVGFGAAENLLPDDVTRSQYLDYTPGTTPVDPPRSLRKAAYMWPFNPDAEKIARDRIYNTPPTPTLPQPERVTAPEVEQPPGPTDHRVSFGGLPPATRLSDLFLSLFSGPELIRFLAANHFPMHELPTGNASGAEMASSAARIVESHGLGDTSFFNAMVAARPRRASDIEVVRRAWAFR